MIFSINVKDYYHFETLLRKKGERKREIKQQGFVVEIART